MFEIILFIIALVFAALSYGGICYLFYLLYYYHELPEIAIIIGFSLALAMVAVLCTAISLDSYGAFETVRLKHYQRLEDRIKTETKYKKELESVLWCVNQQFEQKIINCIIGVSANSLEDKEKRQDIVKILSSVGFRASFKTERFCTDTDLISPKGSVKQCEYKDVVAVN